MEKYLKIVKSFLSSFIKKITSFIKTFIKKLSKLNILDNPRKMIFYILSIGLPVLSYFLLSELKYFTIFLISFNIFLQYLNLCIYENLCIFEKKTKKPCKLSMKELRECIFVNISSFIIIFLLKRFYDMLFR